MKNNVNNLLDKGKIFFAQDNESNKTSADSSSQENKNQENKNNDAQVVKPLKVFGTGIETTDEEMISYYRTMLKMVSIKCKLVGKFTRSGKYIIQDDIKADLVKIYKEISDSGENYFRANSYYMKKYFFFEIQITMLENNKAKASLYLSEKTDSVFEQEYIVSHIADFVDDYNGYFRINVRKAFNLVDVAIINEDARIPSLAMLMQDHIDLEMFVAGLYNLAASRYLEQMLKLLEEAGPEGIEILKRYKELILELDPSVKESKYKYIDYKNMLDRAINEKGGFDKLPIPKEKLNQVLKEMNASIKAIENVQQKPAAIEVMKKNDNAKSDKTLSTKPVKSAKKSKSSSSSAKKSTKSVKSSSKKTKESSDEGEEWEPFESGDDKSSKNNAPSDSKSGTSISNSNKGELLSNPANNLDKQDENKKENDKSELTDVNIVDLSEESLGSPEAVNGEKVSSGEELENFGEERNL